MKKLFLLSLTAAACLAATPVKAQQLLVHQGQITKAYDATACGAMSYSAAGTALTIGADSYQLSSVDSITTTREAYSATLVKVCYTAQGAHVTVPATLLPNLTLTVGGGAVSCVAAASVADELTYDLSGTSSAGSFFMDGKYKSTLILRNLHLTATSGAAIDIENGKRIAVVIPEGTASSLSDAPLGTHKATFFVNGHPEFEGSGSLTLKGLTKHAFASDEYTLFKKGFGSLTVTRASSDGLHVGQYLKMNGGTLTVSGTGGDCIEVATTNDALDEYNGQALIHGGTLNLTVSANDVKGIKAASDVSITGGTINATVSGLGAKGISTKTDLLVDQTDAATLVKMQVTGGTYMPGDATLEAKCRGIKVDGNFTFNAGTISIAADASKNKAISVEGLFFSYGGTLDGCTVDAKGGTVTN